MPFNCAFYGTGIVVPGNITDKVNDVDCYYLSHADIDLWRLDGSHGVFDNATVIDTQKRASMFAKAYSSREELIHEFKTTLQNIVPPDFDYASHIGWYSYTRHA